MFGLQYHEQRMTCIAVLRSSAPVLPTSNIGPSVVPFIRATFKWPRNNHLPFLAAAAVLRFQTRSTASWVTTGTYTVSRRCDHDHSLHRFNPLTSFL